MCILIGVLIYQKNDEIILPSESLRVRIIANSNDIEDLYLKKEVKNMLKEELYEIVASAKNNEEAKKRIVENLNHIEEKISQKTSNYQVSYGKNYFPAKTYKGVIYQEGNYDSLVIKLGEGLGNNWWCVLYPPLCLIEDNENTSNIEYRLAIKNILLN